MRTALPFLFALVTALAWGLYGPTLGQARLADATASPFKPYLGIGIAYLVVAILGGVLGMWQRGDTFTLFPLAGSSLAWGVRRGPLGSGRSLRPHHGDVHRRRPHPPCGDAGGLRRRGDHYRGLDPAAVRRTAAGRSPFSGSGSPGCSFPPC